MQSCMRRTLDKWQLLYTHRFSRGRRGRVGVSGGGGGGGGRGGGEYKLDPAIQTSLKFKSVSLLSSNVSLSNLES